MADEVDVSQVTAADPLETEPVKLVSGTVEVPVQRMETAEGQPLSDLHCPLLVDEDDIVKTTVVETHYDQEGKASGRTIHRTPLQVVTDPVSCPDCGKIVERHMLVVNAATGTRDCAIAVNWKLRGLPVSEKLGKAPGFATALADETQPEPIFPEVAPAGVEEQRKTNLVPDLAK